MTLKEIEVNHNQSNSKYVNLFYPYERLSGGAEILHCGQYLESEYAEGHALILNGIRDKQLFDCKRGLFGFFSHEDDDPTKAISGRVPIASMMFVYYLSVCQAVTHEAPYVPE